MMDTGGQELIGDGSDVSLEAILARVSEALQSKDFVANIAQLREASVQLAGYDALYPNHITKEGRTIFDVQDVIVDTTLAKAGISHAANLALTFNTKVSDSHPNKIDTVSRLFDLWEQIDNPQQDFDTYENLSKACIKAQVGGDDGLQIGEDTEIKKPYLKEKLRNLQTLPLHKVVEQARKLLEFEAFDWDESERADIFGEVYDRFTGDAGTVKTEDIFDAAEFLLTGCPSLREPVVDQLIAYVEKQDEVESALHPILVLAARNAYDDIRVDTIQALQWQIGRDGQALDQFLKQHRPAATP